MPNLSTTEYKMVSEIFNRLVWWEEKIREGYAMSTDVQRDGLYQQHKLVVDLKGFITRKLEE